MKNFNIKKLSIVMLGTVLCAASVSQAYADAKIPPLPLIEKVNSTGFTSEDGVRSETCQVFPDRVLITTSYGSEKYRTFTTKETVTFRATGGLKDVINAAARETLSSTPNYWCDAPGTVTTAYKGGAMFNLFASGGCGSDREERVGPMSRMLVELVNKYCPLTNDMSGGFQPQEILPRD